MNTEYSIDKTKMLEPIKKSKWFYSFLIFGFLINFYFLGLLALMIILGMFSILIVFQMVLQFQYYQHDKNTKMIVDYGNRIIKFSNNSVEIYIKFEDIQLIQRFKGSKNAKSFDNNIIPSSFYNWTRIIAKNGISYSFSDFIKEDLNIFGIKRQEKIIPFLNLIIK
ncbi:MAG: hypothetical protein IPO21_03215 [Bacteroidales bacterium]|nr:hypothetical protein [Bacteroidales bacterium]